MLTRLLGARPRRFRAPRYDVDERVLGIARDLGLAHTRGDVDAPRLGRALHCGFITTLVLQRSRPGTVVGCTTASLPRGQRATRAGQATVDAVATVVPRLHERGFECVTASTLLGDAASGITG